MTETISTPDSRSPRKGFFTRYLKYCLGVNKIYLLISLICSAVSALVFVAIFTLYKSNPHYLNGTGIKFYKIEVFATFFTAAAIWGQYVLCITGGIRCFQHLTRKNKTDTLMCLPLTHSDRFWGDLLTGYLTTAAPLIPCGILGILAAVIARETGTLPENLVEFALMFNSTLFFVMTFAYLLSVLAASLCGNRAGGIVTAVLLAVISAAIPTAWGEYFIDNIIGYPVVDELVFHPQGLVPSFALITEIDRFINIFSGYSDSLHFFKLSDYSVGDPLNIVLYVLLSLGLIALSYLISGKRKCEHTGEIFAAKHAATIITILAVFTMTGLLSCWFSQVTIIVTILSAIVVSALICLAAELILRRGVKKLGKRVIVYAVSTLISVGFSVLISVTYALGMSFYLPSADKIKSVEFIQGGYQHDITQYDAYYTFDQKPDIKKLRENHALLLKKNIGNLVTNRYQDNGNPDSTTVKYTLKNGETFLRMYLISYDVTVYYEIFPREYTARAALKAMPKSLESYPPQYAAPLLSGKITDSEVSLGGVFGTYNIYPEKLSEFSRILHDDIVNHYSPDIQPIGGAKVYTEEKERSFGILETYEKTLAFIKDAGNAEFIDDTAFSFNFYGNNSDFMIDLTKEDMESPAGKELMALMRSCHPSDIETISSEEYQTGIYVSSPDYFIWFIPQSNMPQVTALITQIASERV